MRDGMPPALKWLGAFAVMALVIAVTVPLAIDAITQSLRFEDAPAAPVVDDEETPDGAGGGAVDDGEATALADLSGRSAAVRQAEESFVAIGGIEGDAVYFAFPALLGDPSCLAEARLELTLLEATPALLGVYPADVPAITDLTDGDPLPDEPFLSDEPRAVAETDGNPGVLVWDVTGLYAEWAAGDPFVVAVRPPEYGDENLRVQFAAVEAGEDSAGRLVWTGASDCA